ncbi:MAG: Nascent polypeptide-associated complex protein [Nanoarchaeota archaeon]|nr:Nascent polypeptide-associated complex protein [Nanoarchaeota archaeon]
MNASQMQGMMKKMGISQTNLPVSKVIFEMSDSRIIIEEPSVMRVKMQGQETYQVSGEAREESMDSFSEEDVNMVVEKTGKSSEEVRSFLEENDGDIAGAIMKLRD